MQVRKGLRVKETQVIRGKHAGRRRRRWLSLLGALNWDRSMFRATAKGLAQHFSLDRDAAPDPESGPYRTCVAKRRTEFADGQSVRRRLSQVIGTSTDAAEQLLLQSPAAMPKPLQSRTVCPGTTSESHQLPSDSDTWRIESSSRVRIILCSFGLNARMNMRHRFLLAALVLIW